ncbi:MAG TPA: hypothetical protein VII92_08135 [Anaerolineae bacterium]
MTQTPQRGRPAIYTVETVSVTLDPLPASLVDWFERYAESRTPPVSRAAAMRLALEQFVDRIEIQQGEMK